MPTPRKDIKIVSGRPRTPDAQMRRKMLSIYLTDEQYATLERIAHALGYVSLAEVGRLSIEAFLSVPGLLGPETTQGGESVLRQVARLVVAGIVSLEPPAREDPNNRDARMPTPHPATKTYQRLVS